MQKKRSQSRIIKFMFGLWHISPIASSFIGVTQTICAILTTTIAPIFVSGLLNNIANGTATVDNSIWFLVGYALVLFFGDVVAVRISIALAYISELKMQNKIAVRILEHLTAKSLAYHSNRMSGGIVSDTNKLIGAIEKFWDTLMFDLVPILVTIISVCVALSFLFWQYALTLGLLSIIVIAIIVRTQIKIAPVSRKVAEKSSAMTAYFADVIGNISAVKAFAREKTELAAYKKYVDKWDSSRMQEMRSVLYITSSFSSMMTIMNVCAFGVAILATQYHIATIGTIYLVVSYTINVVGKLWSVSNTTRSYIRVIGDAGPMIDTLDSEIDLKDHNNPQKLTVSKGEITFDKITFTHTENSDKLFHEFSLTVKPGERIGLVGVSGSGKTSLTYLLLRFCDVDSGQILIDGQDIKNVTQTDLHNAIAYVPQEPVLFHRTLKENIAYGKPNATEKEIHEAARLANALDFIETLPNKFNTTVGERGVKLSGGQRQRIAIARAILKNAPILVLDEATSALDSENEKLIQAALSELMENRTSIVIAHRLSTIAKLDRIIVLENGKIIEQGTHQELLANKGMYSKLWLHQSGGFIEQ